VPSAHHEAHFLCSVGKICRHTVIEMLLNGFSESARADPILSLPTDSDDLYQLVLFAVAPRFF
jgi:hypothetical protein